MLKLLVIAPTCDGEDVGEAWVSYQWVSRLAQRHDVTLLTYHKRDRKPASSQLGGVRVVEWQDLPLVGRAERFNSMLKPGYVPFYVRARRWIKQALQRGERFDLAHQLAPVAMRYPSPVAGLGISYVIGPVGGSIASPPGFAADGDTAPKFVRLRELDSFRMRRDPLLVRTYDEASYVIGIAPYVQEFLSARHIRRFACMGEVGIERLPAIPDRQESRALRLLFVGRLIRTKGVRDAIRALALIGDDIAFIFDVVGDGFDRPTCEQLVDHLGLSDRVRFHGRVERDKVDDFYRQADVFVFPSYREPGGNAFLEAMTFALPLIVSDVGGPASLADSSCALFVHPDNPEQYARDIAAAIKQLAQDEALRRSMGSVGRTRVERLALWSNKLDRLDSIYEQVLAGS